MAISVVRHTKTDNGGVNQATCTAILAAASAVGNGLVAMINWNSTAGATVASMADTHNTYVRNVASSSTSATAGGFEQWFAKNNNFGASALTGVVTLSVGQAFTALDFVEITGQSTTDDGTGSGRAVTGAAANTDIDGTAIVASGPGILLVGAQFASNSTGCAGAAGYTDITPGAGQNMTSAYILVAGAGSITPKIHNGGTAQNCVISALFIPEPSAPPTQRYRRHFIR